MTVEAGAPTKAKPADGGMNWVRKVEPFGLIIVWIAMIAVFGYLRPETFLTWANFSTLLGSQAVLVVLTLGLLVPLTANDFDLSIAYTMTLSSMLIAVLNVNNGVGIGWSIIAALAAGAMIGLINGLLITIFRIHSLIVTLGVGTFLHGVTLWMSDSMTISGVSQSLISAVIVQRLFGIPLEFYYAIAIACPDLVRARIHCDGSAHIVRRPRPGSGAPFRHRHRSRARRLPRRLRLSRRPRRRSLHGHPGRGGPCLGRLLSTACVRRRLPGLDLHPAGAVQSLGHDGRGLFPGHRHHRPRLSRASVRSSRKCSTVERS